MNNCLRYISSVSPVTLLTVGGIVLLPQIAVASNSGVVSPRSVLAQRAEDAFPPNPLLIQPSVASPITNLAQLQQQIATLNQRAIAQLEAGKADAAFDLWNQQLRLSRTLGPVAETTALARVGQAAWERGNTQQVRYISERLQQLQAQEQQMPNLALRRELTAAYQVIRAPELALRVDDRSYRLFQQQSDPERAFRALNRIAQTHLDWFDYRRAAQVYADLLRQAQAQENRNNQIAYSYQLAYIYEQAKQPVGAIAAFENLIPIYAKTAQPELLADFQTRLAQQYQLNQQLDQAERTYQQAYRTAKAQQQTGRAGDALRQLGALYQQQQRWDAAIQVYDFLTTFEMESGLNLYNAMDAYDWLGDVWLKKQNRAQAIAAFQAGLDVAQALNYRQQYFTQKITQLTDPPNAGETQ